ncbi:PTS sugar transporter subunit IIB [Jiangella rhizosphaerae]|uniref:PTS sugar transporter subunit IIB n=1 Tax=Jiangella rhizosphaerae TaxID=2293569 RepID=A0A418KG52_9ACTN|nr:PTS sugar transporter subunit IIB [Jiangella rhizosphaerae]RIQ10970.1 PTS sugar transporter subunit IIB [Jiangella rhizosphaerae]
MSPAPNRPLTVLTVCGVGMGSSLILKMNAEKALKSLGVEAKVEHTDVSSARGMKADVAIAQGLHTDDLGSVAPVVLAISNFMDVEGLRRQLDEALRAQGWLS